MTELTGRLTERMMVGAGGALLVGAVIVVDERVKSRMLGLVDGGMASELANAGQQFHHAMRLVNESIPFDGIAHTTVGMFVVAALVLFAMMLKV